VRKNKLGSTTTRPQDDPFPKDTRFHEKRSLTREVGMFPKEVAGPALPRATKAAWRELKTALPGNPREALRMLRKRLTPIAANTSETVLP
jgi:hypothetical protein